MHWHWYRLPQLADTNYEKHNGIIYWYSYILWSVLCIIPFFHLSALNVLLISHPTANVKRCFSYVIEII